MGFSRVGMDWVSAEERREAVSRQQSEQAGLARWSPVVAEIRQLLHDRTDAAGQSGPTAGGDQDSQAVFAIEALLWNDTEDIARQMVARLASFTTDESTLILRGRR